MERNLGPDGATHHEVQQGKAITVSGYSQPRHPPYCQRGPIHSGPLPGTLFTLNTKPQMLTISLDPLEQISQAAGIPAN
ncbi:hypothetical protein AVEN_249581-1 [Araneus ventricosus]|uniref:Uncharacterized protein n=1 Tax=Araneus ventricosus TaxID=182803 RepID=A0A4Y2MDY1_ARAVE|nr:hypothetical protein AVEN_249581-1 [Araneus ventricosus]